MNELSAAENLFLGRLPRRRLGIDWVRAHGEARRWFEKLGVHIAPEAPVHSLGVAQKQMLEIARALSKNSRILILDEPTAALSESETRTLLKLLDALRSQGVACVYISHRLEEVFALADRISVLRDGKSVFSAPAAQTNRPTLIRHMAGRDLETADAPERRSSPPPPATPTAPTTLEAPVRPAALLRVENLSVTGPESPTDTPPFLQEITLEVQPGEILGLGGLMGAGRTSLLMHLAGAWGRRVRGSVQLEGSPLCEGPTSAVLRRGVALVSEDRRRYGFVGAQSIGFNLSLSSLSKVARGGFLHGPSEWERNQTMFRRMDIRAPGLDTPVGVLSGGNQQKSVLGRVLLSSPKVVLLDEPTRGIDVAAKAEIHALIRTVAAAGAGVLLVSSELPELRALSHRILMLREGRLSGTFQADTPAETLLAAAMGQLSP